MQFHIPCQRCLVCCRWPGEVRLAEDEISRVASFKGMNDQAFIELHTRLRQDRRGLALKEQADGSCIFLQDDGCAVHAVKPEQCKDFPSRWVNRLWGKVSLETMKAEYPMLFACSAFNAFLETNKPAAE